VSSSLSGIIPVLASCWSCADPIVAVMADLVSVKRQWSLTQEAFDLLLSWLDPERERAGEKYEEIRARLIKVFSYRGCHTPEELADETINRVARKVDAVAESYDGDPALYFYGVAQMIHLEYSRRKPEVPPQVLSLADDTEHEHQCLDECLDRLTEANRELILQYYTDESRRKINNRKELARRLGIGPNALRIRAHRVRDGLEKCIDTCMKKDG
jgi:DNA-directed RNA polymerase specialized sigma24 family protein